jgi:hypothetical protein
MRPSERCNYAMRLGQAMQFLKWSVFRDNYDSFREDMRSALEGLGYDIPIPDNADEYVTRADELEMVVRGELRKERARLGGDVYLLTLYMYGYIPLELVVSAAWRNENYEPMLYLLTGLLQDFGIETEFEAIKRFIEKETEWLAARAADEHDGSLSISDVSQASLRLGQHIGGLWSHAEDIGGIIPFSPVLYQSVFISYSHQDEALDRLLKSLIMESSESALVNDDER